MRSLYPKTAYNVLSMVGLSLALFALAAITIFYVMEVTSGETNPYLGIFLFLLFPAILVLGLVLIPIGMIRERHRLARGKQPLVVDLGKTRHRNALVTFVVGTCLFLLLSTVGLFKGYEYTESNTFCGEVCHTVMEPEFTAAAISPHARLHCVECHIGPGVDWFVKSKIDGLRQVYKVLTDSYERPIPVPVHSLRPARDTCEQCHWPEKFYTSNEVVNDYFLGDEDNTHYRLRMLLQVGGTAEASKGHASGIHWHVDASNTMKYVSTDESRHEFESVSWMVDGNEVVYTRTGEPLADSTLAHADAEGRVRTLDCIDCHNRPTHQYQPPSVAVNAALASDRLDRSIPWIKREAVRVLSRDYASKAGARDSIATHLEIFYEGLGVPLPPKTIGTVQTIYGEIAFPQMGARWDRYPSHSSHLISDGCFRCHGSDLRTAEGKTISDDCDMCHVIVAQEIVGSDGRADGFLWTGVEGTEITGLQFRHPIYVDNSEHEMKCTECHRGDDSIYLKNDELVSAERTAP